MVPTMGFSARAAPPRDRAYFYPEGEVEQKKVESKGFPARNASSLSVSL